MIYLQAAIRDPDPVCILENELLYGVSFPVSEEAMGADYVLPIGKAKIMREGSDVTLVAFSKMVCPPSQTCCNQHVAKQCSVLVLQSEACRRSSISC